MKTFVINDHYMMNVKNKGDRYIEYRRLWAASGSGEYIPEFPIHIDTDTIDSCNLNCIVCHDAGRNRTHSIMNPEYVKNAIDEGIGKGLMSINIGGVAEPYLKKGILYDLCSYARARGLIDIFIHTNFLLPTAFDIINTVDSGCTFICISVDACTPETYKKIRGGDFEKLLRNVKLLRAYKDHKKSDYPVIRISMVPCKENEQEIDDFVKFWSPYADLIEIQNYKSQPSHKCGNICTKKAPRKCSPYQRLMIWPDGDVSPCCAQEGKNPDVILGNLNVSDISDILHGERARYIRDNYDSVMSCKDCLSKNYLYEG